MNIVFDKIYEWQPKLYEGVSYTSAKNGTFCSCCQRAIEDTPFPDRVCTVSIYSKMEDHCFNCQVLYQPQSNIWGIEGERGRVEFFTNADGKKLYELHMANDSSITTRTAIKHALKNGIEMSDKMTDVFCEHIVIFEGKIVEGKMGMMQGIGMAFSASRFILYASGKYIPRFEAIQNKVFEFKTLGGKSVLADVINEFDGSEPFIFIKEVGKKKVEIVKNCTMNTGTNTVYHSTPDGVETINRQSLDALSSFIGNATTSGLGKELDTFMQSLKRLCLGNVSPSELINADHGLKGIPGLLKALPLCPHERLYLLQFLS